MRAKLASLVAAHFRSKVVAAIFAGLLIFLINRELDTDIVAGEQIAIVVQGVDPVPESAAVLVLVPEPGVAVRDFSPRKVALRVRGRKKQADAAAGRLVGRVVLRESWHDTAQFSTVRVIEGRDVVLSGLPGVAVDFVDARPQVTLESSFEGAVRIDPMLPPSGSGVRVEGLAVRPPLIRVSGPRSTVERLAADPASRPLRVAVKWPAEAGTHADVQVDPDDLRDALRRERLRAVGDGPPAVRLDFTLSREARNVELSDVPLRFLARGRILRVLAGGTFSLDAPAPADDPLLRSVVVAGPVDKVERSEREPDYRRRLEAAFIFYVDLTRFEREGFTEGKLETPPVRWFIQDPEFADFTVRSADPAEAAFTVNPPK